MYKKITLPNNLRVILSPLHETKAVTVLVLVKVGSRYETKKINGISHFVEHMCFKGTKRRPTTLALSCELDQVGAEYNAFTAKDHTGFYVKVNSEKIDLALDILSDIIFHSKFESQELEREQRVIVEEINMYQDNPSMYIESLFEQTLYGSHPLGQLISGTKKSVIKVSRESLTYYKENYYQPKNMVISIAGRIRERQTLELLNKYFIKKTKNLSFEPQKFIPFKQQKRPKVYLKYKNTEQVHLALGFKGPSYFDKDIDAAYLLATILGGSMSSRLFIRIREREGLAYFIRSNLNVYQDTGNLVIQAGLDKIKVFKALAVILEELKKIKSDGVRKEELKRAKEYLKGRLVLELEDSSFLSEWYGRQEILKEEILTPEERFKKIMEIRAKDIKQVTSKVIRENFLNLAIIGPFRDESKFQRLLRF